MEKKNGIKKKKIILMVIITIVMICGFFLYKMFGPLSYGDKVILKQLSNYEDFYRPGEGEDFSKWYFMSKKTINNEKYVELYISKQWFLMTGHYVEESDLLDRIKKSMVDRNIDFGSSGGIRAIDDEILKSFGCNLDTLKCSKMPKWVSDGSTISKYSNGNYIIISKRNLKQTNVEAELLAPFHFIITILESNLEQ